MAALIEEYKQAIQDVLDGRAKEAPRPSELPWTEDKLASMWAAAAAELIAEANSGGGSSGGGVLVVNDTDGTLNASYQDISDAGYAVFKTWPNYGESYFIPLYSIYHEDGENYVVTFGSAGGTNMSYSADSPTDELVFDNGDN